ALTDDPNGVVALLSRIVALAVEAVGAGDGRLVLAEDPAWRHLVAGTPASAGLITVGQHPTARRALWPAHGATTHVLTTGEPVFVTDVTAPSPFGPFHELTASGIKSFV